MQETHSITKLGSNTYLYDDNNSDAQISESTTVSNNGNKNFLNTDTSLNIFLSDKCCNFHFFSVLQIFKDEKDEYSITATAKHVKLENSVNAAKEYKPSVLADHNTFKHGTIGLHSHTAIHSGPGRKSQKRSAHHIKTLDTHLDVDHSFDFVRTLSAENIKLQEANVRLKEADGKRVHEHSCLQKKVKRMERERLQLLNGLEESGFTEAQVEFIKRKGVAESQDDPAAAAQSLKVS